MKHLPIKISIAVTAVLIVIFSIIFIVGAEKIIKTYNINIGAKQILTNIVDSQYIITEIPDESIDEYEFAGIKYKMFCQFSKGYKGYNDYLASHGCTVTTLTAVLRAYSSECQEWTPYETITIAEKQMAGEDAFKKNYSKSPEKQMPFNFYAASQILTQYGVDHEYEPFFSSDEELRTDIINHLKSGKPVMFIISQKNRATDTTSKKWTGSFHTMLMIGTDGKDKILLGNPAGSQRFQMVYLDEMINYMFSCKEEPDGFYWNGKSKCGGYIKIME